jgi:hypothetical protein
MSRLELFKRMTEMRKSLMRNFMAMAVERTVRNQPQDLPAMHVELRKALDQVQGAILKGNNPVGFVLLVAMEEGGEQMHCVQSMGGTTALLAHMMRYLDSVATCTLHEQAFCDCDKCMTRDRIGLVLSMLSPTDREAFQKMADEVSNLEDDFSVAPENITPMPDCSSTKH